jgi:DNA primase
MITKETVDKIFETAKIDEVVGDFVTLKRRGANMIGLCPFHNEKTPSFSVSPVKGIYKCFGCGKGGNSVNFVMEHEHYSFPEALKYLANKYKIEIEETEFTPENKEEINEREGLYLISSYAQKYYSEILYENEHGKAIGLSYFKERGFRDDIIKKFQLGYSLDQWNAFTENALQRGYQMEYLEKTGLTISKENNHYDRFRGRVMFPIHNLSGRVIGFGGRVLGSHEKQAKYVNSPESAIYDKGKSLYGIFFSKKSIVEQNNCYLVEGYADVISLYQADVTNVVASSGTSLTLEQIRLIRRFATNITILYDGDAAGVKASFRAIDMILEEGLNVKIVFFPDGDDPDSFARKVSAQELKNYISKEARDFIVFKTSLLLKETENDPVKKVSLIKEIVSSISLIPDHITQSLYVKEASRILDIHEQTLIVELNKIRKKKFSDKLKADSINESKNTLPDEGIPHVQLQEVNSLLNVNSSSFSYHEKDIIRILINYGNKEIIFYDNEELKENEPTPASGIEHKISVAEFIINELMQDYPQFENAVYHKIFIEFCSNLENGIIPSEQFFIQHKDENIRANVIDLIGSPHLLSPNWNDKYQIFVTTEEFILKQTVTSSVNALKLRKVEKMLEEYRALLKEAKDDLEIMDLMKEQQILLAIKKQISSELGRVITK